MVKKRILLLIYLILSFSSSFVLISANSEPYSYLVVDTGQTNCYDVNTKIYLNEGDQFFGQDANYEGKGPNYLNNGDGTISDLNTGLMWQQDPGEKKTWEQAVGEAGNCSIAGYNDWRLPNIKELYSLILFSGLDVSGFEQTKTLVPFIDTDYFDFEYGDISAGERLIDSQYISSTKYMGLTMWGDETVFGVNFADGRIKGYGLTDPMTAEDKKLYVLYVRGNSEYGINNFIDNGNGTISDHATGLMWSKEDSGEGMDWVETLTWVQEKKNENYLGFDDWRLPNAKELQSIVDYTRSPSTNSSAAIDPVFNTSAIIDEDGENNYPFYWASTTHASVNEEHSGNFAVYIAFGEALGFMESPPGSGNYQLLDVHGAGAQRSDPKIGDPADFPYGHGPQGDVVRIYNYIRLVRGGNPRIVITEPPTLGSEVILKCVIFCICIAIAGIAVIHTYPKIRRIN